MQSSTSCTKRSHAITRKSNRSRRHQDRSLLEGEIREQSFGGLQDARDTKHACQKLVILLSGIFHVWPRIFQGSLGCGKGSWPLLCWPHVKSPSQNAKVAKIPSQSRKILERSLARTQIFRSLGFFEGFLTCGQGSFKDLWGVARDLRHFCVGVTSRVPHRTQEW